MKLRICAYAQASSPEAVCPLPMLVHLRSTCARIGLGSSAPVLGWGRVAVLDISRLRLVSGHPEYTCKHLCEERVFTLASGHRGGVALNGDRTVCACVRACLCMGRRVGAPRGGRLLGGACVCVCPKMRHALTSPWGFAVWVLVWVAHSWARNAWGNTVVRNRGGTFTLNSKVALGP